MTLNSLKLRSRSVGRAFFCIGIAYLISSSVDCVGQDPNRPWIRGNRFETQAEENERHARAAAQAQEAQLRQALEDLRLVQDVTRNADSSRYASSSPQAEPPRSGFGFGFAAFIFLGGIATGLGLLKIWMMRQRIASLEAAVASGVSVEAVARSDSGLVQVSKGIRSMFSRVGVLAGFVKRAWTSTRNVFRRRSRQQDDGMAVEDIQFACPHCSTHLVVASSGAGDSVPCPVCAGNVAIPTAGFVLSDSGQTA